MTDLFVSACSSAVGNPIYGSNTSLNVQFNIALLLYGMVFVHDWQTNFPAPDNVTDTLPLFVAEEAAVTVNVLSSAVVAIAKSPSVAEPEV